MAAVASQPPIRTPAGGTTDQIFQPLADCGNGNPFFYHMYADDFSPYRATDYTVTATGTGAAVTGIAGDGGLVNLVTGTAAGVSALQQPFASFTVNSQPKKVFFECRLKSTAWATAGVTGTFGLIQTTATPGTVTDGVYFALSAAGALSINSAVGSVITSAAIPTAAYSLPANASVDLAFYINRAGDVLAYVDSQLVGFIPQSNIGTSGNPQNAGAVARITAPSLTTAVLNPTVGITQAGTTAVTFTLDFMQAQKER